MLDRILTVRVSRIRHETPEISAFELTHARGQALPGFSAGAHIDVHLPGGFMRQYSLAQATPQADACERYVLGVKREPLSRGGSQAMHQRVGVGDLLAVSAPRNTFPLHPQARRHLLLAGGIGMTPLLAMAQQLAHDGADFQLCVFARSREHLAFAEALADPALAPHVRLHFDAADAVEKIDLRALLASHAAGTHLYLCGPAGFMQAVRLAAAHWPDNCVHLEYFAPPQGDADAGANEAFTLHLAQRGISVEVAADQSAVQALHDLGLDVATSCEQGICGTCVVGYSNGEPEHRNFCLSATERTKKMALCCSRAKSGTITIDL